MTSEEHLQHWRPHPDTRIVLNRGQLFAAQLSGLAQPCPLTEADLCLFHALGGGATPESACTRLTHGDLTAYLPAPPPPENVTARLRQLQQAGHLVQGKAGTPDPAQGIADCLAHEAASPDCSLRVGKNFCLRPVPGGFDAWSAPLGASQFLALDLALLLCAFIQGKPAVRVVQERVALAERVPMLRAIAWLQAAGLLVQVVRPASADAQAGPVTVVLSHGRDWTQLSADDRIPVYFTPHMENHFPLALGMLYSAIGAHAGGALLERFALVPITYMDAQQLLEGPYRKFGPGVWLFSNYMWSVEFNLKVSAAIKAHHAGNLCVHGGPSTPGYKEACERFMDRNPSVDVAVHGEGEVAVCELLDCLHREAGAVAWDTARLRAVHGLTFRNADRDGGGLAWTPPRLRMKEPDTIPSPYLQGVFDAYRGRVEAAIIESNRGCPFGCTFCDWGSATSQKVRKFDLERVKQEIEWIGRAGVQVLWIADANFGMFDRDIDLARYIVEVRARFGHPREVVVNYTKNTTRRLVEIIRAFSEGGIISQGIISIQTTDEATLEVINRRNIKTEVYDELADVFAAARLPLSTDLMIGLPGITPEAWDRDLQRYFDADVSVKAYPTQLLPNSPMADPEYRSKYRIEVDEQDFVVACHSFDRSQLSDMKAVYSAFEIADGYGLLRYVLRFLQWEHGIPAIAFLHRLLERLRLEPARYPQLTWVFRLFRTHKTVPGGWQAFYDQVARLVFDVYAIERDPTLDTALRVNMAAMPDDGLRYPRTIELPHDFIAWFAQRKASPSPLRRLADHGPGQFTVDDPDLMAHIDMDYLQYDSHQYFWELRSAIARPKSAADVKDRYRGVA